MICVSGMPSAGATELPRRSGRVSDRSNRWLNQFIGEPGPDLAGSPRGRYGWRARGRSDDRLVLERGFGLAGLPANRRLRDGKA